MPISRSVSAALERSSWIRRMFEEGSRLRKVHGDDAVFDFALGNPILQPPAAVRDRIRELIDVEGVHRYMPNAGWPAVREKIASHLEGRTGLSYQGEHVVMTVGAGGALNVLFKAILDPGDEVIVFSPYFVEYDFYIQNAQGVSVPVPTEEDFGPPSSDRLRAAITPRTKIVLINYPNNPTGRIYSAAELGELSQTLEQASKETGTPITLVTDEPYRKIVYPGFDCPEVPPAYARTVLITSHSKDLGLAGDRIGYLAISPEIEEAGELAAACTFCNRTLGFVNAPSLFQLAIADCQDVPVDMSLYEKNRGMLLDHLTELGFSIQPPGGAFYLFPRSPVENEIELVERLVEERILVVPGRGFGTPGYFRISFAVPESTVELSLPAWTRVAREYPQLLAPQREPAE